MRRLGDLLRERGSFGAAPAGPLFPPGWCDRCSAAVCACPVCHGAGFCRVERDDGRIADVRECDCHKSSVRAQTVATLAELSVLPQMAALTFDAFDATVPGLAEAHAAAVDFGRNGQDWLVLHGPPGVGKTHLAAAAGHQLAAAGVGVVMHVVPKLLAEFRRSFAEKQTARYHRLLDGTTAAPVLILDDFGAENVTDWAREQLYMILDERYRTRSPLAVTTNSLRALEPRVRDRLSDEGMAVVVPITAPSYRQTPRRLRLVHP